MRLCGRAFRFPAGCFLGLVLLSAGFAESEPKEKPDTLQVPIPVGEDAMGVKIPVYGEKGKLEMTLEMDRAEKLDEIRMQMDGAIVETYDAEDKRDLRISLPKAVINLETRVVTSEEPVEIEREDFSITGEAMEFFLKTRSGKLTGQIRMLIYDRSKISTADETKTH